MNQGIITVLLVLVPSLIVFITALFVLKSMNERHLKEIRSLRDEDVRKNFYL